MVDECFELAPKRPHRAALRHAGEQRRVWKQLRPARTTEQLVGGSLELLAGEVVEGDVDCRDRVDSGTATARIDRPLI